MCCLAIDSCLVFGPVVAGLFVRLTGFFVGLGETGGCCRRREASNEAVLVLQAHAPPPFVLWTTLAGLDHLVISYCTPAAIKRPIIHRLLSSVVP